MHISVKTIMRDYIASSSQMSVQLSVQITLNVIMATTKTIVRSGKRHQCRWRMHRSTFLSLSGQVDVVQFHLDVFDKRLDDDDEADLAKSKWTNINNPCVDFNGQNNSFVIKKSGLYFMLGAVKDTNAAGECTAPRSYHYLYMIPLSVVSKVCRYRWTIQLDTHLT
jgi:hypothetical protein